MYGYLCACPDNDVMVNPVVASRPRVWLGAKQGLAGPDPYSEENENCKNNAFLAVFHDYRVMAAEK